MIKKIRLLTLIISFCLIGIVFYACGENPIAVTTISFDRSNIELYVGEEYDLTVTYLPGNATETEIEFFSYDKNVLDIVKKNTSNNTLVYTVTAKAIAGEFTLTTIGVRAKGNTNAQGSCTVKVLTLPNPLDSPLNLHYNQDTGRLEWEEVSGDGLLGYILKVNGEELPISTFNYRNVERKGEALSVQVKAKGRVSSLDSEYSEAYTLTVLSTPSNVVHQNQIISWNAVNNAQGYVVSINNVPYIVNPSILSFEANLEQEGAYTIKVYATGDQTQKIFNSSMVTLNVTRLFAPSSFEIVNGELVWSSVLNSEGYLLKEDLEEPFVLQQTKYKPASNINAGEHVYEIRALGNGTTTLTSPASAGAYLTKLNAPENLRVENGVLAWDINISTQYYILTINGEEIQITDKNITTYELTERYSAGGYSISIMAVGDGINSLTSAKSEIRQFIKLYAPTTFSLFRNRVEWNQPGYATYYELAVNGLSSIVNVNSCDITSDYQADTYYFKVRAFADGYLKSDYSVIKSAKKLASPTLSVSNGVLTWNSITGASEYQLDVGGTIVSTGVQTSYTFNNKAGDANYVVTIKAIGTNGTTFDSNISSSKTVFKLKTPEIYLDGGSIYYNNVAHASDYQIVETLIAENQQTVYKLYAVGDNNQYINSSYSNSITVKKLPRVTDLHITDGLLSWTGVDGDIYPGITYSIVIDLLEGSTETIDNFTSTEYDLSGYEWGSYTCTVRVIGTSGTTGNLFLSSPDTSYSFIILGQALLSATTGPNYMGNPIEGNRPGIIKWNKLIGALGYILKIKETSTSITQEIDLENADSYILPEEFPAGSYDLSIKAYGNHREIIDGQYSDVLPFTKLAPVTNVQISNEGIISWETSYNAAGNIPFTNYPKNIRVIFLIEINGLYYDPYGIEEGTVSSANMMDEELLHKVQSIRSFKIPEELGAGNYDIYVHTVPLNIKDFLKGIPFEIMGMQIDLSTMFTCFNNDLMANSSAMFSFTRLSEPLGLKMENGIIKWSPVFNGQGYQLNIVSPNSEIDETITISGYNNTEFNLKTWSGYTSVDYEIKVKAITNQPGYVDSRYSNKISAIVLRPGSLTIADGVLKWIKGVGVETYELTVTVNETTLSPIILNNLQDSFDFINDARFVPGSYNIKMRWKGGNETRYLDSIIFAEINTTKLYTPSGLNVENGKMEFNGVDNVDHYNLIINGVPKNIGNATSYELGTEFPSGNYSIRVQAMGGISNLNSDVSGVTDPETIIKLPTTVVSVNNGRLTWQSVQWATGYNILINGSIVNESGEEFTSVEIPAGSSLSMKIENILTGLGGQEYIIKDGVYSFRVKALGTNRTYLNSDFSVSEEYTKLKEVKNFRVEDGILKWDALQNEDVKTSLVITVKKSDEVDPVVQNIGNVSEYALGSSFVAGNYTIYIENYGDSVQYLTSNKSNVIAVEKLATPQNVRTALNTEEGNLGKLTFDKLSTEGIVYDIILTYEDDGGSIVKTYIVQSSTSNEYMIKNVIELPDGEQLSLEGGQITLRVQAMGGVSHLNSEISNSITLRFPRAPQLVAVEDGGVFTGKIVWDVVPLASSYLVRYKYLPLTTEMTEGVWDTVEWCEPIETEATYFYITINGFYKVSARSFIKDIDGLTSVDSQELVQLRYGIYNVGDGTIGNPFEIRSIQDYNKIRYNVTAYYKLMENLDFNGIIYNQLGSEEEPFIGGIDGNGKTIMNVTINVSSVYNSLIRYLGSSAHAGEANIGIIKNLTVENINITAGAYTGGIVAYNYGTVENCIVKNSKISPSISMPDKIVYAGGIVGYNQGIIRNCRNTSSVLPKNDYYGVYAGGITGYNSGTVHQCLNTGTVGGTGKEASLIFANIAGGITGYNNATGVITESINRGSVYAKARSSFISMDAYAGGITGVNYGHISDCYNNNFNDGYGTIISVIYARSDINEKAVYIGGLIGRNTSSGVVEFCYSISNIDSYSLNALNLYQGSLIGRNDTGTAGVIHCYYYGSPIYTGVGLGTGFLTVKGYTSIPSLAAQLQLEFRENNGRTCWKANAGNPILLSWE